MNFPAKETWAISHSVEKMKDVLTFTPAEPTEGYEAMKIEVTEQQIKQLWRQIAASVPFKVEQRIVDGKRTLFFQAEPNDPKATHNTKSVTISSEQWDGLRFSCMLAINDKAGISKLCYL